ncbi:McrB family protein [Pseudoalteromonas sp. A2]|uniref:McrB family protein n=1 Tax=Pseudoalteromonas sp. A2 TaxID=1523412 RepID=UPI000A783D45|nr:restriction endonuclease [Pseudoalteromonas sp. A2]
MLIKLDEIKLEEPLVNSSKLFDYRLTSVQKDVLHKQLGSIGYGFDTYTSFAITDKESNDKPANYALIPNQYFAFASEMYEFSSELFKYFEIYEKLRPYASSLLGNFEQIKSNIRANQKLLENFSSDNDLELFSKFLDKDDATFRLGSKRLINDQGKPRGSRDCFGSVILKEINLPDASSSVFGRLVYDLCQNPKTFKSVYEAYSVAKTRSLTTTNDFIVNEVALSKPFLLLAGISGTGKTRFVREQAKTSKQFSETYCLTSVRPDWHEPSDLLGYISRLTQDGSAEYITTDVLDFIAKAWRAIADSGLNLEVQDSDELGERLVVAGERDALEQVLPYWLCLDEMNLAPVEQYFADYLSVLETREWTWTGDSFSYSSDALLKPATIKAVANKEKLREALGFNGTQYDELWALICQYGLGIPFNLLVAGTVNMDETTHGFSRKVIDRALSFDFGEFFPNDYADFFNPTNRNKRLSYPIWSNASKTDLANTFDVDGTKTVAFLSAVNAVLKNTPFELAFRALNELLLAVASSQPQDDLTLKAVWDDFMMCKVLPRIEGDEDKLVGQSQHNILEALLKVLEEQLAGAWENGRPDLYREKLDPEGETITVDCRSKKKLSWMNDQLVRGFTSFWP